MTDTVQYVHLADDSAQQLRDQAHQMLAGIETEDGVAALSEQFVRGLDDASLGHIHGVVLIDATLVGLLALDGETAELGVNPQYRRQGVGSALVTAAREQEARGVWAHGNLPGARALAAQLGMNQERRLLVMALDEGLEALGGNVHDVTFPGAITAMNLSDSLERFGSKEVYNKWLKVNNEAFSWHPEQGGWDLARLERGMDTDWFNPEDVWLAWDEEAEQLAGFHWTKWHGHGVGEVYVVGVADSYRGHGVGSPLLQVGLMGLVQRGARTVILYVEDDNQVAVAAYEKLGFYVSEEHVVYGFPASAT